MKANWKSLTPDGHWRTNLPIQPEMNAFPAHAQSHSMTGPGAQILHVYRADQPASARKETGPVDVPEAMGSRLFGLTSASARERLRHVSASSQTGSDSDTPEGHGHYTWTARRGLTRRNLARARSYMEDNLGKNFTLDELAGAVGISRFHFSRMFRESTGESPMGYSLRLRIECAKEMLLQGDRKLSEIAVTLGFFDQSHFSRTFRRLTGVSPGEYVRTRDVAEVAV